MSCQCLCHTTPAEGICQCCSEAILRTRPNLASLTEIRVGPRGDMTLDFLPKVLAEVELDKIKIGAAMRELRLDRRVTATYMASAAATSQATIAAMDRQGVSNVATIRRYAEALGLEAVIVFREPPARCPRCQSPDPKRHPAVQFEGEVSICPHPFHERPQP